jgi:hypothetical protein
MHCTIVSHTHWDREWYRTFEEFRYRLVGLLDHVLHLLETDPEFRCFTLDGQTIVLDDYFEVRPRARERVEKWVREGRLKVGPWHVLPDEWLVSGEAILRNLRLGAERAAAVGGSMQVGYVPDQFGHVGQLPQIFQSFGFKGAMLWRGVGEDVTETSFDWEAPDGTRMFCVYLRKGYGNASQLPKTAEGARAVLEQQVGELAGYSRIPSLLMMNGSDHVVPDASMPRMVAEAVAEMDGVTFEIATLERYMDLALEQTSGELELHRGELRSGLRSPLLEGCASARIPQKRRDFENDRLLTRYVEPLATWLETLGGQGDPEIIGRAWELALENHPHDSICGCSIDGVHEQMETRFDRVAELAGTHLQRLCRDLGPEIRVRKDGFGRVAGEPVAVWNPNASGVAVAEGEVALDLPCAKGRPARIHLRNPEGRRVPADAELIEPGSELAHYDFPAAVAVNALRGFPREFQGEWATKVQVQDLSGRCELSVLMGANPVAGFNLAAAKDEAVSQIRAAQVDQVIYRVRRLPRFRVRVLDDFPGCGLRVYRVAKGAAGTGPGVQTEKTATGGLAIANDCWKVEADPDGRVRLTHLPTATTVEDAIRIVDDGDRGDEYTFDPVPGGVVIDRPERVRLKFEGRSELAASIVLGLRYRIPASLSEDRGERSQRIVNLPVELRLSLRGGSDRVDVRIDFDNSAQDHRLRAHLRAPCDASAFHVESAFEVAERPIEPAPGDFGSTTPSEFPTGTTPQRTFSTLSGGDLALTVANRGVPEVEALTGSGFADADDRDVDGNDAEPLGGPGGSGRLALTLLRSVGWLSRGDLAMRPMHAGPGLATPGAQCPGPHRAEFSFRWHTKGDPRRTAEAHAYAHPPLLFALAGSGDAGSLEDGARLFEVDDPSVVVSAIEPRPMGPPAIRLYNASGVGRKVRMRWNGIGESLRAVRLDGSDDSRAALKADDNGAFELELGPWQLVGLVGLVGLPPDAAAAPAASYSRVSR